MEIYTGMHNSIYYIDKASSMTVKGREGDVCEINNHPHILAKIYDEDILHSLPMLEEKLKFMLKIKIAQDTEYFSIAWPLDLLYDSAKSFSGYVMKKFDSKYDLSDIELLCSTNTDTSMYGDLCLFSWKDSLRAACHLSWITAYLHSMGIVIGDFNSKNFLYNHQTGGFTLIDCGSYGIFDRTSLDILYESNYVMPQYTAPEQLGQFEIQDPRYSDYFYLAIHIFLLLMKNSNPFDSTDFTDTKSNGEPGEAIRRHIENGECLYVRQIQGKVLRKYSPRPRVLPDDILSAFDLTFNYTKESSFERCQYRTTALEWSYILQSYLDDPLKVISCPQNKMHYYSTHLSTCPWCNPDCVSDKPFEYWKTSSSFSKIKEIRITSVDTVSTGMPDNNPNQDMMDLTAICRVICKVKSSDHFTHSKKLSKSILDANSAFHSLSYRQRLMVPKSISIQLGDLENDSESSQVHTKNQQIYPYIFAIFLIIGILFILIVLRPKLDLINNIDDGNLDHKKPLQTENVGQETQRNADKLDDDINLIHYYHLDLDFSKETTYRGSFGPNFLDTIVITNSQDMPSLVIDEFFKRLENDPVMAAACFAYIDKTVHTRFTGEFYESISNNWVDEVNRISEEFIDDRSRWYAGLDSLKNFMNAPYACTEEIKNVSDDADITILSMSSGLSHPVLSLERFSLEGDMEYHLLSFDIDIKGDNFNVSFLIETGFTPVVEWL